MVPAVLCRISPKNEIMEVFEVQLPEFTTPQIQELHTPVAMAMALQYIKKLDFVGIINRDVTWDKKQCNLTPGQLALSVVLSTFSDVRSPLYKISQNFRQMDTAFLFGPGVQNNDFTDDALARMLDKVYAAGSSNLFSKIALNGYSAFDIPFHNLHADTTSISLYGDYSDCECEDYEGVNITEGFSKDHRPDLKQVMVGSVVNEHAIPLYYKTLDGNTADCVWNQKTIVTLQALLGDTLQDKVYIADSKAVTLPNLLHFAQPQKKLFLLSRCPDNFYKKIADKVKQQAYAQNNWVPIGKLKEDIYHASYEGQEFQETLHIIDDEKKLHNLPVRLFVYRSDENKKRVEKRLQKESAQLQAKTAVLEKKRFACAADAESAAAEFVRSQSRILIDITTLVDSETKKTLGRGRIGKIPRPSKTKTLWYVKVNIVGSNLARVRKAQDKAESFVLLTTAPSSKLSLDTALWQYKGQHKVEILFHLLKLPALASRIFIKKPQRIEALLMLLQIALLIRSLMQYKAREREKQLPILPRLNFNNRILQKPTVQNLLALLKPITLVNRGGTYSYFTGGQLNHHLLQHICYLLDISFT